MLGERDKLLRQLVSCSVQQPCADPISNLKSVTAGTYRSACKEHICLQGAVRARCVAAAESDSLAAGTAFANVDTKVSPVVMGKHLVHGPFVMCSLPGTDLPLQAASASGLKWEEAAAEFMRTVASPQPRHKKPRTMAARPYTGVLCQHHGCTA